MSRKRWDTFEEQVRGVASLIWKKDCKPRRVSGVNFDGFIELSPEEVVIVEISVRENLSKVREDITKLATARVALAVEGIVLRGWIVLNGTPTQAMKEAAAAAKVTVCSIHEFAATFFEFPRYLESRIKMAFGSAINPLTGEIDETEYVPVSYRSRFDGRQLDISRVCDLLLDGKNIVLLGEYGSGKSRCIRQMFYLLSSEWGETFRFPFAINLRDCWGLHTGREIVRRSFDDLGLSELESSAIRVFNSKSCLLLIDGFDEIGSQAWSTDEDRLKQLRAQAVVGVKDAVRHLGGGCLIAGREHYFSSEEEMFSALGLDRKNTIVIEANDEFTEEQMETYFEFTNVEVDLPTWLPRRPLICQAIAQLNDNERNKMFGIQSDDASFWDHFINVVCERDARINANFDSTTIYRVFVSLARLTRRFPSNVGPISQRDLQEAFEEVVGKLPVEEASVMLLRLPSLGRIGLESADRQFVDTFILDGLRAKDIAHAAVGSVESRASITADKWFNPLEKLGQSILALDIEQRRETYLQLANQGVKSGNNVLTGDIIASFCRTSTVSDLGGIEITKSSISELDLSAGKIENVAISDTVISHIILPSSPPNRISISSSLAEKVSGASSFSGLPAWIKLEGVDQFDSVQTVAQIRKAGLSPAHEVLISILKKTFLQKGAGRKEEALLRGFGAGSVKSIAERVVSLLMKEGILERHKGREGWIYSPVRAHAARVGSIVNQLRSTSDPIWNDVDRLNK